MHSFTLLLSGFSLLVPIIAANFGHFPIALVALDASKRTLFVQLSNLDGISGPLHISSSRKPDVQTRVMAFNNLARRRKDKKDDEEDEENEDKSFEEDGGAEGDGGDSEDGGNQADEDGGDDADEHGGERNEEEEGKSKAASKKEDNTTKETFKKPLKDEDAESDTPDDDSSDLSSADVTSISVPKSKTGSKSTASSGNNCQQLAQIYDEMGGNQWKEKNGWMGVSKASAKEKTCCTWYGITCRGSSVTAFDMPGNNMVGSLSPAIFMLSALERLNLTSNAISGAIPDQLDAFPKLTSLSLDSNTFSGRLPSTLFTSIMLTTIHLSNNSLSGSADFGKLISLVNLMIDRNLITAVTLPLNAPLQRLMINDNLITGRLPDLSSLMSLKIFNAARNNLTGPLFDLTGMQNLTRFDVRSNRLDGNFPESLITLTSLQAFDISNNHISGTFPSSLAPPSLTRCAALPNYIQICPPDTIIADARSLANKCKVSCKPKKGGQAKINVVGTATSDGGDVPDAYGMNTGTGSQVQQPVANGNQPTLRPFDYKYDMDPATDPSLRLSVNDARSSVCGSWFMETGGLASVPRGIALQALVLSAVQLFML